MGKNAITIIACEETYKNLATFKNIEELNKTVRHYKEMFIDKLSKSTLAVLDQLQRYSAKYLGCSFRSKGNIAETLNISRRTVIRACQLLEQLGIIKQHEMKRSKDMQQTSNCIVILPIVTQDKPEIEEECHTKTNPISLKQNIINKRNDSLNSDFVSNKVPKEFTNFAKCFYGNAQTIEEFWRVVTAQTRYLDYYSESDTLNLALEGFKQLIRNIKLGKRKIKNVFGYYWAIVNEMLDQEYFELLNECD
jgi:DNA-binding Lrp family transcriptional regulator